METRCGRWGATPYGRAVRALEPDHLVLLDSGLWVLDARQPVAAVIDPVSGELRRMVSWPGTVPPPSFDSEWVEVAGDGRSLWWQSVGGGLVCVDPDGVATAVRLRKPLLRTAYEGVAWAAPWPEQVLVDDADDPRVTAGPRPGRLVRIDRSGVKRRIETPGAVLAVHADERGTWVLAQTAQPWLHPLGVGYDLRRVPGWLRVPIHPPGRLTFAEHGIDAGPEVVRRGTYGDVSWFQPPGRHGVGRALAGAG